MYAGRGVRRDLGGLIPSCMDKKDIQKGKTQQANRSQRSGGSSSYVDNANRFH